MSALSSFSSGDDDGVRRIYGVVLADVSNNQDPDRLGRVKLRFPWLSGQTESGWARVATPFSGSEFGLYILPEVGDEVLVMFERGDMNHPFVIGALWHSKAKPPSDNGDGKNNLRLIKSRSGHLVQLDDSDGKEKIVIRDKTGKNEIVIDAANNKLSITSDGDLAITAKGKIAMNADGDFALACDNFKVDAKSSAKIAAKQDAAIESANFAADAKQKVSIKASSEIGIQCMAGVKINNDGLVVT